MSLKSKTLSYTLDTLPPLTEQDVADLKALSERPDSEVDLSDSPEMTAEQMKRGVRGRFYQPRPKDAAA